MLGSTGPDGQLIMVIPSLASKHVYIIDALAFDQTQIDTDAFIELLMAHPGWLDEEEVEP